MVNGAENDNRGNEMTETERWHAKTLAEAACAALRKNGFEARYFETGATAADWIDSLVTAGTRVGTGGSMTLAALGLHSRLEEKGAVVLNHSRKGLSPEEKTEVMRAQLTCDLFLSGTNAVTLEGELYNIDGNGNRVAALTFGPKKTVVVVGYNKIVRDMAEAEARLELIASPLNNKRLDTGNACTKTGTCENCKAETRICKVYSVFKRRPGKSDFTVAIVGESLGY